MNFSTKPNPLIYVTTLLVQAELYHCVMLEKSKKDALKPLNGQNCTEIFNTHIVDDRATCTCTTATRGVSILSIRKGKPACVPDEKVMESKNI